MCALTARHLGVEPEEVLVASTGIIGHQLPMEKVTAGIDQATPLLSGSPEAGLAFAHAIMTTDTRCKQAYREVKLPGATVRIAGTVKGAGMIGPNMATTLLFITTDEGLVSSFRERVQARDLKRARRVLLADDFSWRTRWTSIRVRAGYPTQKWLNRHLWTLE